MTKSNRRMPPPSFKAKVSLAVLRGGRMLAEQAHQLDVHPNQSIHSVNYAGDTFYGYCD